MFFEARIVASLRVADDLGVGRFAQHNGVVGSNRASAVECPGVLSLGPAFRVEDWYGRSGGKRHLLSMIRFRFRGTGRMNRADGQDTADRLSTIVANSLD